MKAFNITRLVRCPFCDARNTVTIRSDGNGSRDVEIEHVCPHVRDEYDESGRGIYVYFERGEARDYVLVPAPLALRVQDGNATRIARALRRRGYGIRVDGRHIIFERPRHPIAFEISRALHQYMLNARRTISYEFVNL